MHDFCLTLPYGVLLLIGGLAGLAKGSVSSALVGCGVGSAQLAVGWLSYQEWQENSTGKEKRFRSPTYAYTIVSSVLTLIVTFLMFERWQENPDKLFPAGYVFFASVGLLVFYVYQIAFKGNVGSNAARAYGRND
jgi:hypothetical protein